MKRKVLFDVVIGCTGAIIGAGFASGREMMSFFTRYGKASWLGVGVAALTMWVLALFTMRIAQKEDAHSLRSICQKTMGKAAFVGTLCFFLLLSVTAGSMLSAAGELAALVWPFYRGYELGFLLTLVMGIWLIRRDLRALYIASRVLLPLLIITYILCMTLPGSQMPQTGDLRGLLGAFSYGGMNIALCAPVLCEVGRTSTRSEQEKIAFFTGLLMCVLMLVGNTLFLSHPELSDEALPMVRLLRNFGRIGYYISAALLYLAVFTSFIACMRGIYMMLCEKTNNNVALLLTGLSPVLFALIGFSNLVSVLYPMLGYLCIGMMVLWARK